MIKSIKAIARQDREPYRVPRRVQDVILIQYVWPDSILRVGIKSSKTYRLTDINYKMASQEDKEIMFRVYSELPNSLDRAATTKLTICNRRQSQTNFEQSVLMPMREDGLDKYRREHNQMLMNKATGANGITQEEYVTITTYKRDTEDAHVYLTRIGANLTVRFAALDSKCVELDATDRLRIFHDFYRVRDGGSLHFDTANMAWKGHDFKGYVCPDGIEKHSDYLKLSDRYCRVLFLKDYANYIQDEIVTNLTDLDRNMMLSIDIPNMPTNEAVWEVKNRLLGVEANITNRQRRQNQNNNFSAIILYDMELQRRENKEFLPGLTTRDQRTMQVVLTLVTTADTKQQLDIDAEKIRSLSGRCQLVALKYQQIGGLNAVLPIGTREINAFRTLTTEPLAVFMPFKVQETMDRGGTYLGENAISHNLITCNKANLFNQPPFRLGVPGLGKSFSMREGIAFLTLSADDDILIADPEGKYTPLTEAMDGLGAVIRVAAGGKDRFSAMYTVDGYGENSPIVVKLQPTMSLAERIDLKGVGTKQKPIIDRRTGDLYEEVEQNGIVPTLAALREELMEQPEAETREIILVLELFITGSLDISDHDSTVDLDKRMAVSGIHGLGEQLKPIGHLVITDTMFNRVTLNQKEGRRTYVFIDEFHVMFENEFFTASLNSAWRQLRERNAHPTAITQDAKYLLDSVQASTMLSSFELTVMFNQAVGDREKLVHLLSISEEQMSYITNADAGCDLIKYGSALVPFVNRFPYNTELYRSMTIWSGEGRFFGGRT